MGVRGAWEGLFTPPLLRGSNCLFFFPSQRCISGWRFLFTFPSLLSLPEGGDRRRRYSGVLRQEGARFPITGPLILPQGILLHYFNHTGWILLTLPIALDLGWEGEGVRGGEWCYTRPENIYKACT